MFLCVLPCASVQVNPLELREHIDLIVQAAGLDSVEKLAFALDIDEGQLWRQVQGEGHVSLTRLIAKMPLDFWPRYALALAMRFGVPREAERAADFTAAVKGRRQLKVEAVEPQKRSA